MAKVDGSRVVSIPPTSPERPKPESFTQAELPQRPTYLPEEGAGGRSEIWATLKGLALALAGILIIAWLITAS